MNTKQKRAVNIMRCSKAKVRKMKKLRCRSGSFLLQAFASRDWQSGRWDRNTSGRRSWSGGALRGHEGGVHDASEEKQDRVNSWRLGQN